MATLCAECRMPVRPVNECICDDEPGDAGEALEQWPGWAPLVPGDEGDAA